MSDNKQQLYYKDEKGRYRAYKEPEPPFDNCLYKKCVHGRKVIYEPISMMDANDLPEGVWVITKHIYGKSISNGKYLNDCFMCFKASDIQPVSLAKLGGMDKLADWLMHNWDKLPNNVSRYDLCRAIVGLLFKYEEWVAKQHNDSDML